MNTPGTMFGWASPKIITQKEPTKDIVSSRQRIQKLQNSQKKALIRGVIAVAFVIFVFMQPFTLTSPELKKWIKPIFMLKGLTVAAYLVHQYYIKEMQLKKLASKS